MNPEDFTKSDLDPMLDSEVALLLLAGSRDPGSVYERLAMVFARAFERFRIERERCKPGGAATLRETVRLPMGGALIVVPGYPSLLRGPVTTIEPVPDDDARPSESMLGGEWRWTRSRSGAVNASRYLVASYGPHFSRCMRMLVRTTEWLRTVQLRENPPADDAPSVAPIARSAYR